MHNPLYDDGNWIKLEAEANKELLCPICYEPIDPEEAEQFEGLHASCYDKEQLNKIEERRHSDDI